MYLCETTVSVACEPATQPPTPAALKLTGVVSTEKLSVFEVTVCVCVCVCVSRVRVRHEQ